MAGDESHFVVELREKFTKKFVDPPSARLEKFDRRDVNRIFNDDLYALSFVHWKKEVVDDAVTMVADVLEWRAQNKVTDLSVENIGLDAFKKGHLFIPGRDIAGMRYMVLASRLYTKDDKESVRKLLMFWLERLQRNEPGKHIVFILDTYKTAMSNVDLGLIRFLIDSFTTYFPDLLDKIIILDMAWIMNAIWNIVKQWMSEEQRSRTVFCSRKDLKKYIAADQLPENMNGQSAWTYSFPPFPDDLTQGHDFLNDPMNFEKEDLGEAASLPSDDEVVLANGDVTRDKENNMNNNRSKDEIQKEGDLHDDDATPSTSGLNLVALSDKSVQLRETERTMLQNEDPESAKLRKTASFDDVDDHILETRERDVPTLRRNNTANAAISSERAPQNVSFKSVKVDVREGGDVPTPRGPKPNVAANEIKLGNLLIMSPVSELVFTHQEDKVQAYMEVRNPNPTEAATEEVHVAYKVKTTSPERYHVKPSVGVIAPGQLVQIRILLTPGYPGTVSRDRFLLIYKQIPIVDNVSPSHGQIVRFWKQNSDKLLYSEHRLRVRYDESVASVQVLSSRRANLTVNQHSGEPQPSASPLDPTSMSAASFLVPESVSADSEFMQLKQQLSLLNNKVTRLEADTRWMRRRMRHSMVLLLILIFLLVIVLYEVSSISHLQSAALTCRAQVLNDTYM